MTKKTDLTNDCACVLSHFSRVQLCDPWTVACQALCPWDSPWKNFGVGSSIIN